MKKGITHCTTVKYFNNIFQSSKTWSIQKYCLLVCYQYKQMFSWSGFEKHVTEHHVDKMKLRKVDDTFAILRIWVQGIAKYSVTLNQPKPTIEFMMESETIGQ